MKISKSMNLAWYNTLQTLVHQPQYVVRPRDMITHEVLNHAFALSLASPLLTLSARKTGYRFLAAEAAWVLSGDDRVETIVPYAKHVADFSDDGERFFGAYGPKIIDQLGYVIETLRRDPDSRQAFINIWRESPPPVKDVPCTTSCQFIIRKHCLNVLVNMRSSDVWLGLPYDVHTFAMLAGYVLLELGNEDLTLGLIYENAGSRHLYTRDINDAREVLYRGPLEGFDYAPFDPREFTCGDELIEHLWRCAERKRIKHRWLSETLGPVL